MKKIMMVLVISTMAIGTMAQEGKSNLGIQLGFAQTDLRTNHWEPKEKANKLHNQALNGFKLGLVWDATYIKGFGSMIGMNYTFGMYNSGWKQKNTYEGAPLYPQIKSQDLYHQIELFVDWQYKIEIAGSTYIVLYTGPAVQCQLSLSHKVLERTVDQIETPSINIDRYKMSEGAMHEAYKRLNVTWGLGIGFQYDRYYIRGSYDFGLINPYKIRDFHDSNALKEIEYPGGGGRYTRGRVDQWSIKLGVFFAQFGK